jgi:hypothetical protein
MADKWKMGGNLVELYHDGKVTLPHAADCFQEAVSALNRASAGSEFDRDPSIMPTVMGPVLNSSSTGPKTTFNNLVDILVSACKQNGHALDVIGSNLMVTAQDFAETDGDVKSAFLKQGGKLHG